jgi:hypothetical protein
MRMKQMRTIAKFWSPLFAQTQELNWVQNNSIFLDSIVNLKKNHLKNDTDSLTATKLTIHMEAAKIHNMGIPTYLPRK